VVASGYIKYAANGQENTAVEAGWKRPGERSATERVLLKAVDPPLECVRSILKADGSWQFVKRSASHVFGSGHPALAGATVDLVAILLGDTDSDYLGLRHTRNIPVADDGSLRPG
jgi:hypothetical protein